MREPEFIGGEVDLRINIYRGQADNCTSADHGQKVPDTNKKVPESAGKVPDTIKRLPDNEQERKIYQYVLENGSVTSAIAAELLEVKQRRARVILQDMIEGNYLSKKVRHEAQFM